MDFLKSCEQLYSITHIPMHIVSMRGESQASFPSSLTGKVDSRVMEYVLMDFTFQHRDALHPIITYVDPGYFVGVLILDPGRYCVVGLVSPFSHSREEVLRLAAGTIAPEAMQSFCDMMMQVDRINLDQFKAFLCILVKLAQGVDISEEAILFVDNTIRPPYSKQKLESVLFDLREEEEFHVPMDFESDICAAIEDGNASVLERRLQTPTSGRVGRMSANALQQQKYAFISFATLISRAAIRGGLPNEVAFSLSDIYCQRADVQREIPVLEQLTYDMALDFCTRVAEVRQASIQSPPVRICLDYISQHLHDDLRLDRLAHHCGLCSRSLSMKFKAELGVGITEYIHREKLREAKYLLTHTDHTLTQITSYLNYPTQSYFTQIFKKYEGCTPLQYREDPHGLRRGSD